MSDDILKELDEAILYAKETGRISKGEIIQDGEIKTFTDGKVLDRAKAEIEQLRCTCDVLFSHIQDNSICGQNLVKSHESPEVSDK